ncbi:GYF domain-containing protein [Limnoglobus roseus]|uniref:GYF domain-containing protein n=1 Tax=Limnoglobus roseus TaxID=2598579 RepID=A0A5C1AL78_9BACT|nr:GYF domain-containing protein [Limnoglobus roseus]QEL17658.1 hypothetical protein PX52LOC_04656 [Limnoglobus roseus]
MTDGSWYYAKGGQRVGPFTFAQLQQLAGAGAIAPADPVARDGDAAAAGADVPGLIQPGPGGPARTRLVACPRCQAPVSDAADVCPHCGHTQDPLLARAPGGESAPCPRCHTQSLVRREYAFCFGNCRGCGRPLADLHPGRVLAFRIDQAYADFERWREGPRLWWVGTTAAALGAVAGASLVSPDRPGAFPLLGATGGVFVALALLSPVYYVAFVRGRRGLPLPHDGHRVTAGEWRAAGRRAFDRRRAEHAAGAPEAAAREVRFKVELGLLIAAVIALTVLLNWTHAEGVSHRRAAAAQAGTAMAAGIVATKDEGLFSHEVVLRNDAPAAYEACDLTLVVSFANGRQQSVPLPWGAWGAGERKAVKVSAAGRIERLDLTGTMVDAASRAVGRLDAKFAWPSGGR